MIKDSKNANGHCYCSYKLNKKLSFYFALIVELMKLHLM